VSAYQVCGTSGSRRYGATGQRLADLGAVLPFAVRVETGTACPGLAGHVVRSVCCHVAAPELLTPGRNWQPSSALSSCRQAITAGQDCHPRQVTVPTHLADGKVTSLAHHHISKMRGS